MIIIIRNLKIAIDKWRIKFIISFIIALFIIILTLIGFSIQKCYIYDPKDLVINIGLNESELNFNWISDASICGTPSIKIICDSKIFTGKQDFINNKMKYNKVTVFGLEPGTTYKCQVSSDGTNYSQTYLFKTADSKNITFAAVGDPQIGASNSLSNDSINWLTTVNEIVSKGAYFIIGTGDQINDYGENGTDTDILNKQYTEFISGLSQQKYVMPFAAAIGNHEGYILSGNGRHMFDCYYNIIKKSDDSVYGCNLINYYYMYNDILFVVLDTSAYPDPKNEETIKLFIDTYDKELLEATTVYSNQYEWLIVQTHKSIQSNAKSYFIEDIKAYSLGGFEDLMTKYNVDLVLAGHVHSYVRTYPFISNTNIIGSGGPLVIDGITIDKKNMGDNLVNPNGTIYMVLNSSTGSKYYDINSIPKYTSKIEMQNYMPQYTIIEVSDRILSANTYNVGEKEPIDSFNIKKT